MRGEMKRVEVLPTAGWASAMPATSVCQRGTATGFFSLDADCWFEAGCDRAGRAVSRARWRPIMW